MALIFSSWQCPDLAKSHLWLLKAKLQMASTCQLIMTENNIEYGHTKTTLHAHGVNKSRKIITFSYLNSTNVNENYLPEIVNIGRINPINCVIWVFTSSLRLGVFSSCYLMNSSTSLSITPLVCNAASKLN